MKTAHIPLRRHVHVMDSHVPLFLLLTTFLGPTCVSMSAAPPVVQIIAPAPGTTLVQGDIVRISADVSTPGTWLKHAEFYDNGVLVGIEDNPRCLALAQCQAALLWTNLTLGTHVLTVIAMDRNLVRGTSVVTTVNVDAPAPATLTWTGAVGTHWNTADPNWTGLRTVFHQGDSVRFTDSVAPGSETLFIGQELYPPWGFTLLSMFPGSITISNHAFPYHLSGGVLHSGSKSTRIPHSVLAQSPLSPRASSGCWAATTSILTPQSMFRVGSTLPTTWRFKSPPLRWGA